MLSCLHQRQDNKDKIFGQERIETRQANTGEERSRRGEERRGEERRGEETNRNKTKQDVASTEQHTFTFQVVYVDLADDKQW